MRTYFDKKIVKALPLCKYRGKARHIKYPAFASIKVDGEFQWIIVKKNKIYCINKYGRVRESFPALKEFQKLNPPEGVYLGELVYNEGRTKEDFYNLLRNKESDFLKLFIWGVWRVRNRILRSEEDIELIKRLKSKGGDGKLKFMEWFIINSEKELLKKGKEVIREGYEGLVVRNKGVWWRDGDSLNWIKVKSKKREVEEKTKKGAVINFKFNGYGVWL